MTGSDVMSTAWRSSDFDGSLKWSNSSHQLFHCCFYQSPPSFPSSPLFFLLLLLLLQWVLFQFNILCTLTWTFRFCQDEPTTHAESAETWWCNYSSEIKVHFTLTLTCNRKVVCSSCRHSLNHLLKQEVHIFLCCNFHSNPLLVVLSGVSSESILGVWVHHVSVMATAASVLHSLGSPSIK